MISICPFLQSYVTCHQTMSLWKTFTYTPEKTARSAETSVYAYSLVLRHNISCQTMFYVYGRYSNTKIMRIIENGPKVLMKGSALNWSFFFNLMTNSWKSNSWTLIYMEVCLWTLIRKGRFIHVLEEEECRPSSASFHYSNRGKI